jgi:hypothetical protein
MKKIILLTSISVMSFISNYCLAQDYVGLLTDGNSKTWLLTDLYIGNERSVDTESSCFYQISIKFNSSGSFTSTIPCAATDPISTGTFNVVSDTLRYSNYAVKITSITADYFETYYLSDVTGVDSLKHVAIIQKYRAQ